MQLTLTYTTSLKINKQFLEQSLPSAKLWQTRRARKEVKSKVSYAIRIEKLIRNSMRTDNTNATVKISKISTKRLNNWFVNFKEWQFTSKKMIDDWNGWREFYYQNLSKAEKASYVIPLLYVSSKVSNIWLRSFSVISSSYNWMILISYCLLSLPSQSWSIISKTSINHDSD